MGSTAPQPHYTPLPLPQSPSHLLPLATKLRAETLAALLADPYAFAASHAAESQHPLSVWVSRLAAPDQVNYVCLGSSTPLDVNIHSTNDAALAAALLAHPWAGMVVLRGPTPYADYFIPLSGQAVAEEGEARWHMHALYTAPAHRGRGVAKLLINAVVASAAARSREEGEGVRARVRLFCRPDNAVVVGLYEGLGFKEAGRVTLAEGFVANGIPEGVPGDSGETEEGRKRWHTRLGIVMDKVV